MEQKLVMEVFFVDTMDIDFIGSGLFGWSIHHVSRMDSQTNIFDKVFVNYLS